MFAGMDTPMNPTPTPPNIVTTGGSGGTVSYTRISTGATLNSSDLENNGWRNIVAYNGNNGANYNDDYILSNTMGNGTSSVHPYDSTVGRPAGGWNGSTTLIDIGEAYYPGYFHQQWYTQTRGDAEIIISFFIK